MSLQVPKDLKNLCNILGNLRYDLDNHLFKSYHMQGFKNRQINTLKLFGKITEDAQDIDQYVTY
jgi:glutaminase